MSRNLDLDLGALHALRETMRGIDPVMLSAAELAVLIGSAEALARIKSRVADLVDAGWMSQEAATELRNVYDGDEEGQR